MKTINLRDFYPWYTSDEFVEVSDEVAEVLTDSVRLERNYTERVRYNKAYYSLDAGDGIENEACPTHNAGRGGCDATHYIRVDFLEQIVIQEIHRLTRFADEYEDDFVKAIIGHSMQTAQTERAIKEKTLSGLLVRDKELDALFERIYEDICCKGWVSNPLQKQRDSQLIRSGMKRFSGKGEVFISQAA